MQVNTQSHFNDLEQEIRELARKHNNLVESVAHLWVEAQRNTSDPITKRLCERQLEGLKLLSHSIDEQVSKIPSSDHTAWD